MNQSLLISKPHVLVSRILFVSRVGSRWPLSVSPYCKHGLETKNFTAVTGQAGSLVNNRSLLLPVVETRRYFFRRQEFGHRKKEDPSIQSWPHIVLELIVVAFFFIGFIDYQSMWREYAPEEAVETLDYVDKRTRKWWREALRVDAASPPVDTKSPVAIEESEPAEKEVVMVRNKIGFRERKIIEYENRIRSYSTPDKIFRYFATIKIVSESDDVNEVLMTPHDFLRALTPGLKQPDGLGLDQFKKIELVSKDEQMKLEKELNKDSVFYRLSDFGLINFSDFLFLLTVLSVSRRHFEIAFRMFDLNGDGNVDYKEFEKVQNAILQQTSIGQKLGHSLRSYSGFSSGLSKYFFGEDLKQKLTIEKFLDFQSKLQTEMLTLEFNGKYPVEGSITEVAFAELLIAYGGFSETKKQRMVKRVKRRFKKAEEGSEEESLARGIPQTEYMQFFHFLQNIADVDIALTFFNMAGAGIDKDTLRHAASTVAHVDLSDHLIDVIFTLFDENQDGSLSNREFVSVMKERLRRGLSRPKDTGFMKLVSAFVNAAKIDGIFL
ncbi:Calcium uptake protein 1 -like protein, mitochondrial [Halotydeus destructor]|nr:Calcium uptake protein 1 -like protein, mitochondrial [Halotydeus destructor]